LDDPEFSASSPSSVFGPEALLACYARGVFPMAEARQIFKGWMFASSPAISGLQHPIYDAWVVGCKA
jgi:Leu/Phe-tRNA-protein transferase